MYMKRYLKRFFLSLMAIVMLCACDEKIEQSVDISIMDNAMRFKVVNISNPDENSNSALSSEVKVSISVNGSDQSVSDELKVASGDEIEVEFIPEYSEQHVGRFIMPDGTEHVVSADDPKFLWTVPADFNKEAEIKGSSTYERNGISTTSRGTVLLKPGRM